MLDPGGSSRGARWVVLLVEVAVSAAVGMAFCPSPVCGQTSASPGAQVLVCTPVTAQLDVGLLLLWASDGALGLLS